jgi:hypothetical protein
MIESKYRDILLYLKQFLGNGETDSDQLNKVGFKLIHGYKGTYACDEIPLLKNGESIIVNQGNIKSNGYHWCGLRKEFNKLYFYDSFGRGASIIPSLKSFKTKIKSDTTEREQMDKSIKGDTKTESNCGQRSMGFLMICQMNGVEDAMLI